MIRVIYNKSNRTFSISEPFINPDGRESYKVVYRDTKTNRVGNRNFKAETPAKALDKFKRSDTVHERGILPTQSKVFKMPNQLDQAEAYKARLKQDNQERVQKTRIITSYGNNSN